MRERSVKTGTRVLGRACLLAAVLKAPFGAVLAADAESPAGVIQLDETVISGNQELPKVLYIVPWQQPEGLPQIDLEPHFAEAELFRRLYPPAYRRELGYHEAHRASADSIVNDSKE